MPVHAPHKPAGEDPGPSHRLRMCRLAAAEAEGISACGLELERGGTSYTVDTLEQIHAKHPDARLTFIVGADTARTLGSWRAPGRLLELAELAVATRIGSGRNQVLDALGPLAEPGAAQARVRFLSMPAIDVSSSLVRERVARGEPIEELVGPAVAAYIAEHRLYGAPIRAAC
jgi:nicotinate-nucleotide adenylyltransferase